MALPVVKNTSGDTLFWEGDSGLGDFINYYVGYASPSISDNPVRSQTFNPPLNAVKYQVVFCGGGGAGGSTYTVTAGDGGQLIYSPIYDITSPTDSYTITKPLGSKDIQVITPDFNRTATAGADVSIPYNTPAKSAFVSPTPDPQGFYIGYAPSGTGETGISSIGGHGLNYLCSGGAAGAFASNAPGGRPGDGSFLNFFPRMFAPTEHPVSGHATIFTEGASKAATQYTPPRINFKSLTNGAYMRTENSGGGGGASTNSQSNPPKTGFAFFKFWIAVE